MTKTKLYEGSWMDYQDDLKKYVTEKVIHDNWLHFIECHKLGEMPCKAVSSL